MNFVYRVRVDSLEGRYKNTVLVYGMDIFSDGTFYRSVPALFTERRCAQTLARLCNHAQLPPDGLEEVLKDADCCFSRQHLF